MLQDTDAWIKLGRKQLDAENYGAALIFFNQALTTDPENINAWKGRVIALQKLGSIQEILSVSNHAIAKVLYERGRQLEQKGDYAQAIKSYDQALVIKPEFEEARQSRSNALKNLQSVDFSSFVLLRSSSPSTLTNDSHHQSSYAEAEDLRRLGRYQEAIPYLNEAIQQQPDNHLAYDGRGNALRKLGRYEEAILDSNEAIKLQPEYHLAYYHRGDIQRKLGRYEEAILDYTQAIKLQPEYHLAYNGRGNTYRDLGRYQEAIDDFNKAIELQPNDHLAYNNRGAAKRKLGRYEEAIDDFKQSLQLSHKQNWRAWVNLGWTYFQDRNYYQVHYQQAWQIWNEALSELEPLKQLHPQNPEYQRGCGELHWCKGKAHYRYELQHLKPHESWGKADESYELALKTLTFERFSVRHLEVWQDLIQFSQYLKYPDEVKQLLSDATDLLRRLLEETQSESAKILLSKKFASFNQMGVDVLVQAGEIEAALELAEERKNLCLTWLRNGWRDPAKGSLNYAQMQELLSPHTAVIYWHISPSALTTFILRYKEAPVVWTLKPDPQICQLSHIFDAQQQAKMARIEHLKATVRLNEFEKWMLRWKWKYEMNRQDTKDLKVEAGKGWREEMPEELKELVELLDITKVTQCLSGVDHLILIPHRDLHLLPLHALFPDEVTITYLSSIQVGIDLQQSSAETIYELPLFSIEHPETAKSKDKNNSLLYAEMESVAITQMYQPIKRLAGAACTLEAVIQALKQTTSILHFTGHAYHNINSPTDSALLLANAAQLTLRDIFDNKLDFSRYHLICLSACETGKTGKQGLIDEFVGLAAGFLAAGASCVVSTLWRVDEISAALVMIRFYQLLREYRPATALRKAQLWLRDTTYETIAQWCRDVAKQVADYSLTQSENWEDAADNFQEQVDRMDSNNRPYDNPYYWAAFTITGMNAMTIQQSNSMSDVIALEAIQKALKQLDSPLPDSLQQKINHQLNQALANPQMEAVDNLIDLAQQHESLYKKYRAIRKNLFKEYQAKPKDKGYTPTPKETSPTTTPNTLDNTVAPRRLLPSHLHKLQGKVTRLHKGKNLKMSDLIYPTLDLFAYNLGEGLGDNQDDLKKRRDKFLALLPHPIQTILAHGFDKESTASNTEYIELFKIAGGKAAFHEFTTFLNNYALKGYYYPVRLSETYGLLFDCSVDEKIQSQDVSCLRYLKQQADSIQADLGKTWIISGSLPASTTDTETLAKNIYKALLAEEKSKNLTDAAYEALITQEWQYRKTGNFLSASVFEISQTPQNWRSVEENCHVLIFLYPDQQTMQTAAQFYDDWMRLLCYRNKIVWAYCEAQKLKGQLQTGFKTIREAIPTVKKKAELSHLQAILERNVETFSNYVINLNYLEIQRSTLKVNLQNYQEYLSYIKNYITTNTIKFGDTDLNFLEDFSNIVQHKYQIQTKKDYESLFPGIAILENLLNTIRGIVEIEQAERDRRIEIQNTNFQNAVAVVGVSVGTASVIASAVSPFVESITQLPSKDANNRPLPANAWLNFGIAFIISIAIGALLGWFTLVWLQSRRKHSNK